MVKIRLRRTGAKKQPSYRVVVTDSRTPRDGRFIEIVGHYNPRSEPSVIRIHEDRVLYWLSVGAQPTDPVRKLLTNLGTLDRFARLKEGADLEELLAEAKAAYENDSSKVLAQTEPEVAAEEEETDIEIESSSNSEDAPAELEEVSPEEVEVQEEEVQEEDEGTVDKME